jgi:hypothetical protein
MLRSIAATCIAIWFAVLGGHYAHAMSCDNRGAADRLHYGSSVSGDKVTICAEYWLPPGSKAVSKQPSGPAPKVDPYSFVVSPEKPRAIAFGSRSLTVGDSFVVTTTASSHLRKGVLMGRLALVRFTPTRVSWFFGDGARGVADSPSHFFKTPGVFGVGATVTYAVRFQFVGATEWIHDPRSIELETNVLRFTVSTDVANVSKGRPLLVLYDCFGSQRKGC